MAFFRTRTGGLHRGRRIGLMFAAVCLLALAAFPLLRPRHKPFEVVRTEESPALQWAFITPYGEGGKACRALCPTEASCAALAGMPVEITFCTMEKFLNMTAAGVPVDAVTCWYTDPSFKRLETTGAAWALQDLLDRELPGFTLPEDFVRWCGNMREKVYAYPHTSTILTEDTSASADTVMIARRDMLEKFHWTDADFQEKAQVLEQLKTIRKTEPALVPCYLEFSSLQQMFGAAAVSDGEWTDVFFHPATLEALEYMNSLYRERLLSPDVFTLSAEALLAQLENGELFLAASPELGRLLACLPEDSPVLEQYEIVSPLHSDSGREPAFASNFNEQYASTLFLKESAYPQALARLLAAFYRQNMPLSEEQKAVLQAAGLESAAAETDEPQTADVESRYIVPTAHYEILFSHYSNTRLAAAAERRETYCGTQVVRLVEDCAPEEVAPAYEAAVRELQSGDFRLLLDWKESRYQQAAEILQNAG